MPIRRGDGEEKEEEGDRSQTPSFVTKRSDRSGIEKWRTEEPHFSHLLPRSLPMHSRTVGQVDGSGCKRARR